MSKDISLIRDNWYRTYLSGQVEDLKLYESDDLVVIGPDGIESQDTRLPGISAAVSAGRWFPAGSEARDDTVVFRQVSEGSISAWGIGQIMTPRGTVGKVFFSELWKLEDSNWRVVLLHFHQFSMGS
jgi:hypothetical protein